MEHEFYFPIDIWDVILPKWLIFFKMVKTTNQVNMALHRKVFYKRWIFHCHDYQKPHIGSFRSRYLSAKDRLRSFFFVSILEQSRFETDPRPGLFLGSVLWLLLGQRLAIGHNIIPPVHDPWSKVQERWERFPRVRLPPNLQRREWSLPLPTPQNPGNPAWLFFPISLKQTKTSAAPWSSTSQSEVKLQSQSLWRLIRISNFTTKIEQKKAVPILLLKESDRWSDDDTERTAAPRTPGPLYSYI